MPQYTAQDPSEAHLGKCTWRHSHASKHVWDRAERSTFKNVIGLSSAENVYYALTEGGCSGQGLQSLFADWNLKLQLSLHTDSSSAKAVASRRGADKSTRHITDEGVAATRNVGAKHLRVVKVTTEINPADMTKAFGRTKMEELWSDRTSRENGGQETQESHEAQKTVEFAVNTKMIQNKLKD